MPATAWRKALQHVVTVRRNTTAVSPSGATKFVYADVATLRCSLQDRGGRLRQDDLGQVPGRSKSAIFGSEAAAVLQQNDLLVVTAGESGTYRITHIHIVPDKNAPHVEAVVEQWAPSGSN
jgi:hypothetical protein